MPAPKSFLNTNLGKTVVGSGAAVVVGAVAEHVLPHVVNGVGYAARATIGGVKRLFSRSPGVAGAPHTGAAGKPCCGSCARGGPCEGKTATTGGTAKVSFDREALRDGVSTATHAALDSLFPGLSDMLGPAPEAPARQAPAPQRGRSKCAGADVGLVLPLPIPFLPDGNDDSKFKEQMEKEKKRVAALNKQLLRDSDARKLDARLSAAKAATDKGLQDVERRVLAQLKSAKDEAKQELETKLRALRTMRLTVPSWGAKQVKAAQEPSWMEQMMMKIVDRQLNPPAPAPQAPAPQAPIMVNPWGFAPFGPGFPSPGFPVAQQQQAPMYQAPQGQTYADAGQEMDLAQIADEFALQTLATDGFQLVQPGRLRKLHRLSDDEAGDDDEAGGDSDLEFLSGVDDDEAGGDGDGDDESGGGDDESDGDDDEAGGDDDDESGGGDDESDGDDDEAGGDDDDESGGDADLEFLSGFDNDLEDDDDDDDESGGCGCAVS